MITGKNRVPGMTAMPAAIVAALLLAGCSSGHIGDDWQCPLAAGGACNSVATADPAVSNPAVHQPRTLGQPLRLLPRESRSVSNDTPRGETSPCATESGFDPFGWLARLFGVEANDDGTHAAATPGRATSPGSSAMRPAPAVPTEADSIDDADTDTDTLRTGERVARIWIAPFVDAGGIYREAAHVRVVLEPAGWRLK